MSAVDPVIKNWAIWTHRWWLAAARQAQRILEAPSIGDRETEMLLFIDALRNATRGAERVLGAEHPDYQAFERQVPDVKALRDMLQHFDEYVAGKGWLRAPATDEVESPWMIMTSGSDDEHSLWIITKTKAAPDDVTSFVVDTQAATRRAAELVLATLLAAGITEVSPSLQEWQ